MVHHRVWLLLSAGCWILASIADGTYAPISWVAEYEGTVVELSVMLVLDLSSG